jgi:hemoglobin/transferrin/lactoferrin receptor protein
MEYLAGTGAGRVIDDEGWGFDVSNTSRFSLGAVKVAATYGYEYFADDFNTFNKITPGSGGGSNPAGDTSIAGAFSQLKFSLGNVDLITGLRYDTYSIQATLPNYPSMGQSTKVDIDEGRLNPKATLAAKVLPWLQPYVTYAETMRAPTLFEVALGGTHPGGGIGFKANPFLEPEVSKGWEFGFNIVKDNVFKRGDAFRFKAAYFDLDVENYIVGDLFAGKFLNIAGISQVRGFEVEGKYDAGFFFGSLAYTHMDTSLPPQMGGLGSPNYMPEHTAVLTVGLRLMEQRLTVGGRISYFSETDVGANNVGFFYESQFMPGYTLVDLFSSYRLDNGLELGVTATNLFDIHYTSTTATPFGIGTANCFGSNFAGCHDSGRGRTVLFTAKLKF